MSVIDRTRTSATTTLGHATSGLSVATDRVRALPEEAWELVHETVQLARRQAYATLGAGDVLVATVTRQRTELPARAKQTAEKFADTTKARVSHVGDLVAAAQGKVVQAAGELTERSTDVVSSVRGVTPAATAARVKDVAGQRTGQAKDAYVKLTVRGEQVATDLRHDPVVARVIRQADTRVDTAANGVTSVAQKVRARASSQAKRESAATTATPVRPTPAKRVPVRETTSARTKAAEAPVSDTATHRAAAEEARVRKAAAEKAAATRKAKADEAAAKRKAAADKAAATRKQAAAERKEAAEVRKAAAVKAAATRKKNAADASA